MALKKSSSKKFYKKKQPKIIKTKEELPHNSRRIPAFFVNIQKWRNPNIEKGLLLGFLLLFLILLGTNIAIFYKYQELKKSRVEHFKRLVALEKVINDYPASSQTYYTAAIEATRLKDQEKARYFLEKALFLNPEFEAAKKLQEELLK